MIAYLLKGAKARTTTLQLNIDNLFNRVYATDLAPFDGNTIVYGTPRSFMASVRVDF